MKLCYRLDRLLVAVLYSVRRLPGRLWRMGRGRTGLVSLGLAALAVVGWLFAISLPAQAFANTTATRVYGQGGSFTSSNINNGGLNAASLYNPRGVVLDPNGGLYVVDEGNSRVLHYSGNTTSADRVYGQQGSFTSNNGNNGGISATSLYNPYGVAVDPSGGVYIADTSNNRVLHYSGANTTADQVYGQKGSFTSGTYNNGGISADSLNGPYGIAADPSGGVYVADTNTNRVLYYSLGAQLTINNVTRSEGNSGTTPFSFTVSLSYATSQTVTVQYATADNTATTADNDYQPITGTLTIPPNQITGTITVQVNGDTRVERDESFALNLTNPTGAILGSPATGIGTILNDDSGGAGCNPLVVTSNGDDGSCGTLRAALVAASTNVTKTVNVQLSAGSVISLTSGLTLTTGVAITTTAPCGIGPNNTLAPPVTIQGVGSGSGVGLTLAGNNRLYGLWVRGFSGVQIKAPAGSHTKMQCVRASKN